MAEFVAGVHRTAALIAGLLVILALAACGEFDSDKDSSSGAATSSDSNAADTVADVIGADKTTENRGDRGGNRGGGAAAQDDGEGAALDEDANTLSEEQQVTQIVEGMYANLAAGDAAGVCAAMSSSARTQIAQQVPGGTADPPSQRTCAKSLSRFMDVAAKSGALTSSLGAVAQSVAIENGIATVKVSFKGSPGGQIRLTKEDGEWRFGPGAVTGQ